MIMRVREYFTFTKRERNGILSLVTIMLFIVFSPQFFCKPAPIDSKLVEEMSSVTSAAAPDTGEYKESPAKYPFVRTGQKKNSSFSSLKRRIEPFEINVADTTQFIALPGIGSKLAARIVTFREKLGGFYEVNQIREVYGLQDSVFKKILPLLKCDPAKIRKISINDADRDQLKMHPYIRWNIAEAVVSYREQHGRFSSPDDLSKLENVETAALEKMMPYISFNSSAD